MSLVVELPYLVDRTDYSHCLCCPVIDSIPTISHVHSSHILHKSSKSQTVEWLTNKYWCYIILFHAIVSQCWVWIFFSNCYNFFLVLRTLRPTLSNFQIHITVFRGTILYITSQELRAECLDFLTIFMNFSYSLPLAITSLFSACKFICFCFVLFFVLFCFLDTIYRWAHTVFVIL